MAPARCYQMWVWNLRLPQPWEVYTTSILFEWTITTRDYPLVWGIHPPIHQTLVGGCQAAKFEAVAVILLPFLHDLTCETMGNCCIFWWSWAHGFDMVWLEMGYTRIPRWTIIFCIVVLIYFNCSKFWGTYTDFEANPVTIHKHTHVCRYPVISRYLPFDSFFPSYPLPVLSHCIISCGLYNASPNPCCCKVFYQLADAEGLGFQPAFKPERVEKDMGHGQPGRWKTVYNVTRGWKPRSYTSCKVLRYS